MAETPLVSICCLSFNHGPFIKDCIEGFLSQETDFAYEILIHDDASTDGTAEMIKKYEEQYPDKIFPLYETVNQYSNGYKDVMDIVFNYRRARGKYIAYCEGDDYWTDPKKLQKQVDFMESHPDYSVCFHRCKHLYTATGEITDDGCGKYFKNGGEGVDITMDMFFASWITQPLTMMFRVSLFSEEWQKQYNHYRDMHEIYHLLKVGKGYLMPFVGGVYRYHSGGIHSMISKLEYCEISLPIDEEFYRVNPIEQAKRNYLSTLQECVAQSSWSNKKKALKYLITYFKVSKDVKGSIKWVGQIIKRRR